MQNEKPEYKIVFLGDSTVGKTSIVNRFMHNKFDPNLYSTIGCSFNRICHQNIYYNTWDTAGQERYRSLASMYYRKAQIMVIVYDASKDGSLTSVDEWISEIYNASIGCEYKIIIVGNKIDLTTQLETRLQYKTYSHLYASAKNDIGLNELFHKIYTLCSNLEPSSDDDKLIKINTNPQNYNYWWFTSCWK